MDISNITQNLLKNLEQKNTEQLASLSRVLNLVLGKPIAASVTSTAAVTPQERQDLLKQTTDALAQLNKQGVNQATLTLPVKAEISRLLQQQNLIQSPDLKWVNLLVNNRPLITYTDRPVSAGQTLNIQLQTPQKLVLLDLPEDMEKPAPTAAPPTTDRIPASTNAALNNFIKIANAQLPAELLTKNTTATQTQSQGQIQTPSTHTESDTITDKNISTKIDNTIQLTKDVVANSMRQLLPHKDAPNLLFNALSQWQQLSPLQKQQLVSPKLEQILKSVAEQIRSPMQLSQPKILTQIVKNSGVFFENKLSTFAKIVTSNTTSPNAAAVLARTYNQDTKGALLTLLNRTTQELGNTEKPLTSAQTQKIIQQVSSFIPTASFNQSNQNINEKSDSEVNLASLMQQLMSKPVKELSNKELRTQLLLLLQQHSVHSLAKIQLQQLHSLNQDVDNKDRTQPNASWQIEIPVKHQNDVQPLHVRIDREWVDEKNPENENKTVTKVKQWSVTLRFDLPKLGEFCAQLAIIETSVSATLWAAQEKTFDQVKIQMEVLRTQLEQEGIQVKQLQCVQGMPKQKPISLGYSLIDIST